ncbi:nucleoside-diphosphate-sugar epimerase [Arthrobacter pigmenti]|uniref:Nucleoside-diphosphate-sugar epimerase n=1 Tax=Arthrobacter pigmenti TaxID=271432 RepID=A0A846RJR3_9MICC|nr:NAD-dependent epimerase/dehydratase family protein [Arthrobacter pigmenti]NJC23548.1 nucleoside-diphosphate-sugar epimerase [Arthrobacter pigmenti]
MRIAVIGATGNVGTAVLRRLQQARQENADISLVGVSRRKPSLEQPPYTGVEWHTADVGTDAGRKVLTEALKGADAVVHLAWAIQPNRDEDAMHRTNVTGTQNTLQAAADAGVRHFVCASSVGAYSPAPKDQRVTEDWPTGGIPTSHYSRHKAAQEDLLDAFERDYPEIPVARVRPGLIFQADAGEEIGRFFLGPLVPKSILNKLKIPVLPIPSQLIFQSVHAADMADAYWRIVDQRASGAFNIAAEPVLTPALVGGLLGAKRVLDIPVSVLRAVVAASWSLHLQATDPGWIDMAAGAPVMNTDRARTLLGWEPTRSSVAAMREVIDGMADGAGVHGSPSLRPGR